MTLNPIRALRIIEGLIGDPDDHPTLSEIYKIAHQANNADCAENHPLWTDRALELEKELVENRTIPAWPLTDPAITVYDRKVKISLAHRLVTWTDIDGHRVYKVNTDVFCISPTAIPASIWDIQTAIVTTYHLRHKIRSDVYLYESLNGNSLELNVGHQ